MKRIFLVAGCWLLVAGSFGQTISSKLATAFKQFENDPQLKHAISSLHVIDAKTGKIVFSKNAQIGLVPASTQKVITAATAFELLGKDYRYKTELGYTGNIDGNNLNGNLFLKCSGDPTLGSGRYSTTKENDILRKWLDATKNLGIESISGNILYNHKDFSANSIPDGWIWEDIGNYYGAGADILNWKENQYDIYLKSGNKIGDSVEILGENKGFINELSAAAKNSGDNAYVYLAKGVYEPIITGTIPINEKSFKISAADPYSLYNFFMEFGHFLNVNGIKGRGLGYLTRYYLDNHSKAFSIFNSITTHYSPSLDSIIYWFLQKSVNLYGEALIKTFAYEKKGFGSTDGGVEIVKDFWKQNGIDEDELRIVDGSGLSPLNRVTTHAQVEILKYAKQQPWFPFFYDALPDYNNMKMKSGTLKSMKGFSGYHTSRSGQEYIFSFVVNNYTGTHSSLVSKMYRVLNVLK